MLHSSFTARSQLKPFNPRLQAGVAAAEKHRWLRLDVDKPLGEALRSRWLVEFPLVHVALPGTAPGRRGPALRFPPKPRTSPSTPGEESDFPLATSSDPDAPPPGNRWL